MKTTLALFVLLATAAVSLAGVAPAKSHRMMPEGLEPTRAGSPVVAAPGAATAAAPKPTHSGKWIEDFDEAVSIATAANLPLFLNFTGSDWCPWCKFADQQVFSHKEWRDYAASRVVPVFVDFPRGQPLSKKHREANEALSKKYGIRGFPTFLVLSPDGEKVLGQFGISQNESFLSFTSKLERFLAQQ